MRKILASFLIFIIFSMTACKSSDMDKTSESEVSTSVTQNAYTESELDVTDAIEPTTVTTETTATTATDEQKEQYTTEARHLEQVERNVYNMQLVLDAENKSISNTVNVIIKNDSEDDWNKLCFRDYAISVIDLYKKDNENDYGTSEQSEKVLGSAVTEVIDIQSEKSLSIELVESDNSIIFVHLESPLPPNGQIELKMQYTADVPLGAYRYAHHIFKNGTISFELANFYPILAVYEDGDWVTSPYLDYGEAFYSKCADYTANVTAPDDYTVIASGKEKLIHTRDGLSAWEITADNMRDFTITISNNLTKLSGESDGITINSYYFTEGDVDTPPYNQHKLFGEASLHAGIESIKLFNDLYGYYPYEEIDIVETNFLMGGMEYPALVRISNVLTGYMRMYDESELEQLGGVIQPHLENVVAHEIAHQWFYALIGNDSFSESWIDESFADFSKYIFMQEYLPREEVAKQIPEEEPPNKINLPIDQYGSDNYGMMIYGYGTYFIYHLYNAMGDDDFFDMMKDYYEAFKFKEAKTDDFLSFVRKHAPNNDEVERLIEVYIGSR